MPAAAALQRAKPEYLFATCIIPNAPSVVFDGVFIPTGVGPALSVMGPFVQFVAEQYAHGKAIAGIGDAVELTQAAHVDPAAPGIVLESAKANQAISGFIKAMLQHRFPARQPETMLA